MGLFGKKGPPNIEKLKAKKNVKGLLKALKWRQHSTIRSKERGLDELDRKNAAIAVVEISGVEATGSLIDIIREAEHKKHLLSQFDKTDQDSKVYSELSSISRVSKEALPLIGQGVDSHIIKFLKKWKLDLEDVDRYRYWDTIKKSLMEVLTDIGDEKVIMQNLIDTKDAVRSETFSDVFEKWFKKISTSDENLVKVARMAAQATKTNDHETFNTIRSALRKHVDMDRFTHVIRTQLSISEQDEILNTLVESHATMKTEEAQATETCAHCMSEFFKPKTMTDKTDFNAMQKVRVGCSKCGKKVCFSCAATAADQHGKGDTCICPACGAELGRSGEAGELGEHFDGWN